MQLDVQWVAATPAPALSWTESRVRRFFDVKPHPSLVNQFDIPEPYIVVPHALRPRDGFYRLFSRDSGLFEEEITRLPDSSVEMGNVTGAIKSISGELFPGVLLSRVRATVNISAQELGNNDFDDLHTLRSPRNIPVIDRALRMVNFLAAGDRELDFHTFRYPNSYFGFQLRLDLPFPDFQSSVFENTADLVALLIGTRDPMTLNSELVDAVLSENDAINQKSRVEYLMLNRQGTIYLIPAGDYTGPHTHRFARTMDLACLALFTAAFYQNSAHSSRHPVYNEFVGDRLSHWVEASRLVFKSSESNKLTWDALSHSLALRSHLDHWQIPSDSHGDRQSVAKFRAAPSDWWSDPDFPQLLEVQSEPDESSTACIHEPSLREFIMADRLESMRCRITGNYRASVVMAGIAIEGILLDIVLHYSTMTKAQAVKLGFQELIEAACPGFASDPPNAQGAQRYINVRTAQLLDNVFRKWRNYVHPGVALRSGDEVTKAVADSAIAALDLLLEELT
ncbi:hypothetical protein [Mycolicibacterium bacteremicum]|uniref:hypothetical protein n=1 Tax=Mycolicibacterium bacteremicum TaxID=564198 RepID=UPI0010549B6C|nr:hypothetical protein [Mycolicibacterium bacteremicum]MCV7434921.1 hypothetical protein [Mycolicibacterium bacteremicum]